MFEQIVNFYIIVLDVIGLIICLFRYVDKPRRSWIYVTVFLLGNLLSDYYWGAYQFLMNDYPDVSDLMAYTGVNISFIPIILLLLHIRSDGEKRFFSPISLLPVPLNAFQFSIYIQYGGYFNNIWQCTLTTVIAVLSLNAIIYYLKNKKNGAKKPYVPFVLIFFVLFEYIMWTSSCYEWPNEWLFPYNYASILAYSTMVTLPLAVLKTHGEKFFARKRAATRRIGSVFKPIYVAVVVICCVGGYFLTAWIRDVLDGILVESEDVSAYSILNVMLFISSAVLVVASIAIIFVVYFGEKAAEADSLREERENAVKSNEAKSEFLASMSHEIRTPMGAVLGMNEMILRESLKARDELPEERDEIRRSFATISNYAGYIESSGNNLLSLINDILDFSKIEAGKMEIVNGDYKLSSLLNDVSNMIYFRAKSKGLSFIVDVDEELPDELLGDEEHLRQAVVNVLNNAVKYTPKGSVKFSVHGEKELDNMNGFWVNLIFEIKDTGIGIRKEDTERMFAKFERVDLKMNKNVQGTGLGLAITRNLLEMMGGEVTVESEYGKGSTFTIRVPQQIRSSDPVGNFREKFERSMGETSGYHASFTAPDARILVVDDAKMNLTVATGLLKETKMQIDTSDSGMESVFMAEKTPYDLILMDQRMPQMEGHMALKMIREQKNGANTETPIICLTADAVVGARERYLELGYTDYITKPIDSEELEKMLAKYLPAAKVRS